MRTPSARNIFAHRDSAYTRAWKNTRFISLLTIVTHNIQFIQITKSNPITKQKKNNCSLLKWFPEWDKKVVTHSVFPIFFIISNYAHVFYYIHIYSCMNKTEGAKTIQKNQFMYARTLYCKYIYIAYMHFAPFCWHCTHTLRAKTNYNNDRNNIGLNYHHFARDCNAINCLLLFCFSIFHLQFMISFFFFKK